MDSNINFNSLDEYLQFNDCMERVKFLSSIEIPQSLKGTRAYSDLARLVSMSKAIYEEYPSMAKPPVASNLAEQAASNLIKQMVTLDQTRGMPK